ncbi:MAG TPA: tetratricopeptide repeat protein [Pyrinomonadaceae bacterium]|nr:tetratricopeptide repeat protein [Pyrinomonadaceae bacterium]
MKRVLSSLSSFAFVVLFFVLQGVSVAQQKPPGAKTPAKTTAAKPKASAQKAAGDEAQNSELEEIAKLGSAERVERLEAFVKENPKSPSLLRARELLTSARAALGDERLRAGDHAAGIELFRAAVAETPAEMSDKLFAGVVSQLPANLYVMGERDAGLELARAVEARAAGSAQRLLSVASFYLGVERPDDAARVAKDALALQPDSAPAHQTLGTAYRYALRLDDAASEFERAHALDPTSAGARRTLAELRRATGKPEEALALYREQLTADPQDANARTGLILSLFDAGKREEAERELQSALTGEAKDLPLLVGASYWYSAHGDGARALELAEKAVAFESRFGWAWTRIAEGRALLALKRPLDAERAFRAARSFGNFPTLDYELAAALSAAGLYDEAVEQLSHSFVIRDGQIETRLAGRVEARAADFGELLAPERRASLSQFEDASSADEARTLRALLAFNQALSAATADEKAVSDAAREFGAGEDEMRSYRDLYIAERLERRGEAEGVALEHAEAAKGGVEPALDVPHAPVALYADTEEMRALRRQVVEYGAPLDFVSVQRDVLSKVMRGRIEELAGWALYNQGQSAQAAVRLRRAVSVLPEDSIWWRTAEWRLGAALEASGGERDALIAYITSYRAQPDPTRRAVIEALFKRLNNGSLQGLDQLLQTTPAAVAGMPPQTIHSTPQTPLSTPPPVETVSAQPAATPDAKAASPDAAATSASTTTTPTPEPTPAPQPATVTTTDSTTAPALTPTPSPEPSPTPSTAPTDAPKTSTEQPATTPTPSTTPTPDTTPAPTPEASPTPQAMQTPQTPAGEPAPQPASERKSARAESGVCTLVLSDETLSIRPNGGRATITISLENYSGSAPRVNPSTDNWADIYILAEPHVASDGNSLRFTVSSNSTKTGTFNLTFDSPCGKRNVTVNVK